MLKQHDYYVYYDGANVMARMGDRAPIVMKACKTPQDAHDEVQKIVNPTGIKHDHPTLEGRGFHHPKYQAQISDNCAAVVKAAYAAVKK